MTVITRLTAALMIAGVLITSGCATKGSDTSAVATGEVAPAAAPPSALPGALGPASALIASLSSSIPGLSQAQAILGAGSMFGLAKAKMPADQFTQVANAVPGSQALVDQAVTSGLPPADQLTGPSSLTPMLSKAGISPTMASQIAQVLGQAVTKGGGKPLGDAFMAALR